MVEEVQKVDDWECNWVEEKKRKIRKIPANQAPDLIQDTHPRELRVFAFLKKLGCWLALPPPLALLMVQGEYARLQLWHMVCVWNLTWQSLLRREICCTGQDAFG
jgi:hypothetical protein